MNALDRLLKPHKNSIKYLSQFYDKHLATGVWILYFGEKEYGFFTDISFQASGIYLNCINKSGSRTIDLHFIHHIISIQNDLDDVREVKFTNLNNKVDFKLVKRDDLIFKRKEVNK